jgi:hypothetical protein
MRTKDGESEVPLATYEHFASRDALSRVVLERLLADVSTRRYRRTQEPVGDQVEAGARSTTGCRISRVRERLSRRPPDARLWTTSRRASRDDCSATEPAVSGGRLARRRTAPSDDEEQSCGSAGDALRR